MAANLFNRYIWLVDNILRAGDRGITLEEINRRWIRSQYNETGDNYPERSFHRHKNAIKELFDIDIECNKRTGCYSISNSEDIDKGGVRTWLLNTFAVNNLINESHRLKRRILFEEIPSGQKFLTTIIEAMRDGLTIMLTYQSFNRCEPATFEVHPYCVKVFKQRWYLVAYSPWYDAIRIYALDRVFEVETTETKFKLPKSFDAKEFFSEAFGIIIDEENYNVETVKVKVLTGQREYFRTLPLHPSQQEMETADDYSVFAFRLRPTFDFVQELRRYGSEVEVLAPQWLREEFDKEAKRISQLYTDNILYLSTESNQSVNKNKAIITLTEHVRRMPGMYIGRLGDGSLPDDGLYVLLHKIIARSVEEHQNGFGNLIEIAIADKLVTVRDFGQGIPLNLLTPTVSENCPKVYQKERKYVECPCGIGLFAVNALSSEFTARSVQQGAAHTVTFVQGLQTGDKWENKTDEKDGTMISFRVDTEIFGEYSYNMVFVEQLIKTYCYLNKGLTIKLNGSAYTAKNGLPDLIKRMYANRFVIPNDNT